MISGLRVNTACTGPQLRVLLGPQAHGHCETGLAPACLAIDAQLDAWTLPAPAMALRGRVVRAAPVRGPALALWARLWWSGLGFGAALAGALAGAAAVAMAPAIDASSDTGTTFGVVDSQDR